MALPTRLTTNLRMHQDRGNESMGGILPGREGGAVIWWVTTDGSAPGFYTRGIRGDGAVSAFEVRQFTDWNLPFTVVNEPGMGLLVAVNRGSAFTISATSYSNPTSQFEGGTGVQIIGSVGATYSGAPLFETTNLSAGGSYTIGTIVNTSQFGQLAGAAIVTGGSTAYDDLFAEVELNNGTRIAERDAFGGAWNVIDAAAAGISNLAVAALQGSGSAARYELHIVSGQTFADTGPPRIITTASAVKAGTFELHELSTSGQFIATWIEGATIVAQRFDAGGLPIGSQIRQAGTRPQDLSVVSLANGEIILLWADTLVAVNDLEIAARQFRADGTAVDVVFSVNATLGSGSQQTNPSGVQLGDGRVLVVFDDFSGGDRDVLGRYLSFVAPDAVDARITVAAGGSFSLPVLTDLRDPNGDTIAVAAITQGANGTVATTATGVSYTPRAGFTGTDSFTYTLTDPAGNRDSATVTVTVTAAANAAPVFTSPATASAAENVSTATVIYTAVATDAQGQVVTYALGGADAAALAINPQTGAVTFRSSPDYETKASYSFTVTATDNASTPLSASQAVTLTITDVAEGPPAGDQYQLAAGAGAAVVVRGGGQVIGAAGLQEVTVLDGPGRITLDGSFNQGGDRIVLAGAASAWTVRRSGSAVELSDGDTFVLVPTGTSGADVRFADGVRTLALDTAAGVFRIGGQAVGNVAAQVTAPAGTPTVTGLADPSVTAQSALVRSGAATVGGNVTVFGSDAAESVTVLSGTRATFDGSFNSGGDVITLPRGTSAYTAGRSGSAVVLTSATAGGEQIVLPVGTAGLLVRFDGGGEGVLRIDAASGQVKLGNAVIGTASAPLTTLDAPFGQAVAALPDALGLAV